MAFKQCYSYIRPTKTKQDGGHGSHLGFLIEIILAIFNLQSDTFNFFK